MNIYSLRNELLIQNQDIDINIHINCCQNIMIISQNKLEIIKIAIEENESFINHHDQSYMISNDKIIDLVCQLLKSFTFMVSWDGMSREGSK